MTWNGVYILIHIRKASLLTMLKQNEAVVIGVQLPIGCGGAEVNNIKGCSVVGAD